ncbi:sirohydrochlorin ferrochelatase [Halobacillus karajensis]|uniref:sirohydrochlorin chelatase n=1 Tax=Halobacillus karajensis TaxID=195088 RepID=UPI0008A78DD0|nr:sirohydrochlorin chelatase [Halobacillus karajensis]SEH72167.1 sirohydrochlorin ferrochelatase [Halobacillus karajensis]
MEAVLYISHGSRWKETESEAVQFLTNVQKNVFIETYEICFLELADPDVLEGIHRLVQKGATKIVILPVLLLSAGHYYQDIPEEIHKAKEKYPHVSFTYGQPLGIQDRIVDVLVDRIDAIPQELDETVNIILVGRGSRHPDTKKSIESIAVLLKEKLHFKKIETSYLAAISPRFQDALEKSMKINEKTLVVPYLLFTGVLYESMKTVVQEACSQGNNVYLTSYLKDHPNMIHAVADRVLEGMRKASYLEGVD